jgi:hypothetical protein
MFILQRAPYDEFTLRQFIQLSSSLKFPHDAFYISSPMFDRTMWLSEHVSVLNKFSNFKYPEYKEFYPSPPDFFKNIIKNNIKESTILLGTKDHYTGDYFNPWTDSKPSLILELEDIFLTFPDKTFILFTSVEYLESYLNLSNVKIVPWGGDITNQFYLYDKITPVIDKNLESQTTFLCLNRNHRYHRELVLSYILDNNLENYGIISCMFQEDIKNKNHNFFKFNQQNLKDSYIRGNEKLKTYAFSIQDNYHIYKNLDNDNVSNFQNKLTNFYKNTFIEIIMETSYFEKCFLLTEKTSNCIHGCNFPIWISSAGTVKFLRELGLDVFDDVINHGYDLIEDPVERANLAIKLNIDLLSDQVKVKELWQDNKQRFINNSVFLKTNFLNFYKNRTLSKFQEYTNSHV